MAYNPTKWVSGTTPLSAENLNKIEQGIVQNETNLKEFKATMATPFVFKGKVSAVANLPQSGNNVNDTYYVVNAKMCYTWTSNGTWEQSSMSEDQYLSRLQEVENKLDNFAGEVTADSLTETVELARQAMKPSDYDPRGLGKEPGYGDIYAYAANIASIKANDVQANLNIVNTKVTDNSKQVIAQGNEIEAAHVIADNNGVNHEYDSLKQAIEGGISIANAYTNSAFTQYKAFTVRIVDEIDFASVGEERVFYLIPNASGTGYDKYWYVYNNETEQMMWDSFGSTNTLVVSELPEVGDVNTDYLLKAGAGYVYYKYIDNKWEVVAGSMAEIVDELPEEGSSLTDYYVLNDSGIYVHYRWMPDAEGNHSFVAIGTDSYSKEDLRPYLSTVTENATKISSLESDVERVSRSVATLSQTVNDLDTEGYTYEAALSNEDNVYTFSLIQNKDGESEVVSQFNLPATGGGSGSGGGTVTDLSVSKITVSPYVVTPTDKVELEFNYTSTDADGQSVDGTYNVYIGSTSNAPILTGVLSQGSNKIDVTSFCEVGTQTIYLRVTDEGGSMKQISWKVQMVDVRITSSFSDRYYNEAGREVRFSYTPFGAIAKTVHYVLDGEEIGTEVTSISNSPVSYTIPAQSHGAHLFEVYMTATVNNQQIETDHIYKDIMWFDASLTAPVIGCAMRADYRGVLTARQYDTTEITYYVYDPRSNIPTVKLYLDGELYDTITSEENRRTWNYREANVGVHTLKIVCGETSVEIKLNIEKLNIDVTPITGNLEIDFNPNGLTNNSVNRIWSNKNYRMSVSDNFDWSNGGYQVDENGDTYFCVKAGTTATFNYNMFPRNAESNPSTYGTEMKLVFKTENVQDAKAVWFSNLETTVNEHDGQTVTTYMGIQLSAHDGFLKTNNASDSDVDIGEGDSAETVAASNTYLYLPYSEEDIIEMDINIDPLNREDASSKAFVMAYEDGVPSKAYVYDSNDNFYQLDPKPIVIGSEYCDVRIYRMKIYSTSLSTENIMKNFIADARNSVEMLDRYDRNSIYYNNETNTYTPYSGQGALSPERLAKIIPNVKVLMLETDHFTTSKKVFVKSSLRCIHAPGGDLYPGDEYKDNWLFENGYHSGQGTTSDNYGNSGRNVDFLFNCDGKHKPSDKVNAEENYISKLTLGYGTESATVEYCDDWMGSSAKVDLTRTSVPNNFFNLKVNIASSENVNNALLQKRYNDYLPYISPAKKRDNKVKNDMEFVPAVLFIRETNPDVSQHTEFRDSEWHFYALGNIGDSKKTDYTRAYDPEDMNEFVIEISDNTKNNATFQSGVYLDENGNRAIEAPGDTNSHDYIYPITAAEWNKTLNQRCKMLYEEAFDGDHSFEPRYACCGDYRDGKIVNDTHGGVDKAQIEKNADVWRAFYRWVVTSTDEEFVQELDQWCVRSAVEFFYAFTHIYTMMDNRAKNTFWHFAKTGTYRKVNKPVAELLHVYCEPDSNAPEGYSPTRDESIRIGKEYYTQYAFDLWDYDNDTALGINNNGELIFPYGKEDGDYNIDGDPASGYVFNGAESAFWCRLRDLCQNEIRTTFNTTVANDCFSATSLINQFDAFQECYPEEVWRLDIERKYMRTFTGKSVDNSIEKSDVQYLRDMMQGRKKYQRRQWVRDQEIYFGTMNLMNTVVGDNNRITFRCYDPGTSAVVPADYTIKITPFADMYVSAMFGNGDTLQRRAKAGEPVELNFAVSTSTDTQVTIYGANRIAALNDLSACYIAANNFSMATKLRKLVIGNSTPGYSNNRLTSLTLGNNKLLEELDIRNCGALTGSINLAQCSNLLKLYAEGTRISGVTFADNGKVRLAHLPSTINTLYMRNLNNLEDFDANLANLQTLTLEGGTLDSLELVSNALNTLQVIRLYNLLWTGTSAVKVEILNKLLPNAVTNILTSVLTGKIEIDGSIRLNELNSYKQQWPDLEINYDENNYVTQYQVTLYDEDKVTKLGTVYVDQGSAVTNDAVAHIVPTKESDAQYHYSFDGWTTATGTNTLNLDNYIISNDTNLYAHYDTEVREYTVKWYAFGTAAANLLQEITVKYGESATYIGPQPTRTADEAALMYYLFKGWDTYTGYITGDTVVKGQWELQNSLGFLGDDVEHPVFDSKDLSALQLYALTRYINNDSTSLNKYFETADEITVKFGHDIDYENYGLDQDGEVRPAAIQFADELTFDGSSLMKFEDIIPMSKDQDWTIALDYEFTNYNNSAYVGIPLVSCFDNRNSSNVGFQLFYNSSGRVAWGNSTVTNFAYQNYRNMLVMCHSKGDPNLKLYLYDNGTDMTYKTTSYMTTITKSTESISDVPLVLGGAIDAVDKSERYCAGKVHFGKIWYIDLSTMAWTDEKAKEVWQTAQPNLAMKIASWPHETYQFEYIQPSRQYTLASGNYASGNFIMKDLLPKTQQMNSANTNVGGWNKSKMRSFLNTKLLLGLSDDWRMLIKETIVKAMTGGGNNNYEVDTSRDFLWIPSYGEMNGSQANGYADEYNQQIQWFTSDKTRVKFRGADHAVPVSDVSKWINSTSAPANPEEGIVWVNGSTYKIYHNGTWMDSQYYWLRSAYPSSTGNFTIVNASGYVSSSYNAAGNSYGVCACFSI